MGFPEPLDSRDRDRATFFAKTVAEPPLWRLLYDDVRERAFPPKLPPLELTSRPIPVADRMATNTNPWAIGTATIANTGIALLVILLGFRAVDSGPKFSDPVNKFVVKDFPLFAPFKAPPADRGSGGGVNDPVEANKGRNPKFDMNPVAPVQVPVLDNPKLAIENTAAIPPELKLPDNETLPMVGLHDSTNVRVISGGPGSGGGMGPGSRGGWGPGEGSAGWGPGSNGIYVPGRNGVTQPIPIFTPEAEFSDEARRQKYQGVCVISLIVDAQGNPQNPRVVRPLGLGLDQKALQAVERYRFKPAKKDGKPVAVVMVVEVDFRLY